jgi:hypothetical protein
MNGTLVKVGEFLVDDDARRRKMGSEWRKVLRHRAGLVWENFGGFVKWPAIVTACASVLVGYVFMWVRFIHMATVKANCTPCAEAGLMVAIIVAHILMLVFGKDVYNGLRRRFLNVKNGWNP